MKHKILILCLLCINLFANGFGSSSIKFQEKIEAKCGIAFYNSSGIKFKNEQVSEVTRFYLYSNNDKKKIKLNFSNLRKSNNLLNISNSRIFIVLNRNEKIRINEAISKNIVLEKGIHQIYVEVDEERDRILSGIANIQFDVETICRD